MHRTLQISVSADWLHFSRKQRRATCLISALVYCNKNFWIQSTFTGTAAGDSAALFDSYSKPPMTTNIQTHTSVYNFISRKHTVIVQNKHTAALTKRPGCESAATRLFLTNRLSPTQVYLLKDMRGGGVWRTGRWVSQSSEIWLTGRLLRWVDSMGV